MLAKSLTLPPKQPGCKRIITISDIHLGNRATSSDMVIDGLNRTVTNYETMITADALIVAGDLFDRLLNLALSDISSINKWFIDLLYLSRDTNCAIRILEGTPSHDWKQSKFLFELAENFKIDVDLQYIDTLCVVDDATLGMTIGYVPDEWRESHEQTTKEMREILATRALKQVDIMVMHGMFEFQIPKVKIPTFETKDWLPWVRYMIVIGHDHKHKTYDKIIVPSSHNRLAMNEEDDKGYIVTDICNDVVTSTFIINPYAKRYDTIDVTDLDPEQAMSEIKERLTELRGAESKLRIRIEADSNLESSINEIKKQYGLVTIQLEKTRRAAAIEELEELFVTTVNSININADNISDMILRAIVERDLDADLDAVTVELDNIKEMV